MRSLSLSPISSSICNLYKGKSSQLSFNEEKESKKEDQIKKSYETEMGNSTKSYFMKIYQQHNEFGEIPLSNFLDIKEVLNS